MSLSDFYSDSEVIQQLAGFFEEEEQVDFNTYFNQITDRGLDYSLEIRGRVFSIDKLTGIVREERKNEK